MDGRVGSTKQAKADADLQRLPARPPACVASSVFWVFASAAFVGGVLTRAFFLATAHTNNELQSHQAIKALACRRQRQ